MILSKADKRFECASYLIMSLVTLIIIVPFLVLFLSSVTQEASLLRNGYSLFPKEFSLDAYRFIWESRGTVLKAYGITLAVTVIGTVINLSITALVAYPLSLERLPGKAIFSFLLLFPILFSGGLLPTYMTYTTVLHIKNTFFALLVPNLLFSPMNAIIVRTFMRTNIPIELYESAKVDGGGHLSIFLKITLPLSKPIFVTVGIFAGLGYWNDWMNGLYYVSRNDLFSIQQLLNRMIQNIQYLAQYGTSAGFGSIPAVSVRMAIAFVAMLPILLIYPFLQKYFEKGITLGALKG